MTTQLELQQLVYQQMHQYFDAYLHEDVQVTLVDRLYLEERYFAYSTLDNIDIQQEYSLYFLQLDLVQQQRVIRHELIHSLLQLDDDTNEFEVACRYYDCEYT